MTDTYIRKGIANALKLRARSFSKKEQKVELLLRNAKFLDERTGIFYRLGRTFFKIRDLTGPWRYNDLAAYPLILLQYPELVSNSPIAHIDHYFKDRTCVNSLYRCNWKNLEEEAKARWEVLLYYRLYWGEFCDRWNISPQWNGNLDTLTQHMRNSVFIIHKYTEISDGRSITISIDRWATKQDFLALWEYIKKLHKPIGKKKSGKDNFSRDICWYELAAKCGLKPSEIARLWKERYPMDLARLTVTDMAREKEIDIDVASFLKKLVARSLSTEERIAFNNAHSFNLHWRFNDAIRKAINRIRHQINDVSPKTL